MGQPITKSSLSEKQGRLVGMLQQLNFGRIEALQVRGGMPHFEPPPRIIQKMKMGAGNGARPEADLEDFWLKSPMIDLLQTIADLGNGVILSIDVRYGLPFAIEVEQGGEFRPSEPRGR